MMQSNSDPDSITDTSSDKFSSFPLYHVTFQVTCKYPCCFHAFNHSPNYSKLRWRDLISERFNDFLAKSEDLFEGHNYSRLCHQLIEKRCFSF